MGHDPLTNEEVGRCDWLWNQRENSDGDFAPARAVFSQHHQHRSPSLEARPAQFNSLVDLRPLVGPEKAWLATAVRLRRRQKVTLL